MPLIFFKSHITGTLNEYQCCKLYNLTGQVTVTKFRANGHALYIFNVNAFEDIVKTLLVIKVLE